MRVGAWRGLFRGRGDLYLDLSGSWHVPEKNLMTHQVWVREQEIHCTGKMYACELECRRWEGENLFLWNFNMGRVARGCSRGGAWADRALLFQFSLVCTLPLHVLTLPFIPSGSLVVLLRFCCLFISQSASCLQGGLLSSCLFWIPVVQGISCIPKVHGWGFVCLFVSFFWHSMFSLSP